MLKKRIIKQGNGVWDILQSFSSSMGTLKNLVAFTTPILLSQDEISRKKRAGVYKKIFYNILFKPNKIKSGDEVRFKKPTQDQIEKLVDVVFEQRLPGIRNQDAFFKGVFLLVNSHYESLLKDLLIYNYQANPEKIVDYKLNINLSDFKKFRTITAAISYFAEDFISREIDGLNLERIKDRLKKEISLEPNLINWELINEIRERRNNIVHRKGKVDDKYILKSKNPFELKLNDQLFISLEYLNKSFFEIQFCGCIIAFNCISKWDKDYELSLIQLFRRVTYWSLVDKELNFVTRIYQYSKRFSPKNSDDKQCLNSIRLDYCIALRDLKSTQKLISELGNITCRSLTPIQKVSFYILKGKFSKALVHFSEAVKARQVTLDVYKEHPVFRVIWENETLNASFLKAFKKS